MKIDVDYIDEPTLEFSGHFLHADKKMGLAQHGPYGRTDAALHPDQIRVGIVGTRETADLAAQWLEQIGKYIETDKTQKRVRFGPDDDFLEEEVVQALTKNLTPDFVGMGPNSPFASTIVTSERWRSTFTEREARIITERENPIERVERTTDLFADHIERIATASPHPNVILVALPDFVLTTSTAAELSGGGWLNLRRGLKARSMKWGVPVQLLRHDTLLGKKVGLQDRATRAWNFATALYFKAGGVPWRGHGLEAATCYIGITFYRTEDAKGRTILRSGVAQAFDYLGQGVVLRGEPFEWDDDENGKSPHLTFDGAKTLIAKTLHEYQRVSRLPPKRVVIHKSSRFWGEEHEKFDERNGFIEGIESINKNAGVDLVTLAKSSVRLARVGDYPPVRGTFMRLEDDNYNVLYTHGFNPYFDTYPGVHVPEPWTILEHYGDTGIRELAREVLALTKMNVNNANFSDGEPITLAFSRMVSEVLKQVGPDMPVRSEYSFYM